MVIISDSAVAHSRAGRGKSVSEKLSRAPRRRGILAWPASLAAVASHRNCGRTYRPVGTCVQESAVSVCVISDSSIGKVFWKSKNERG